MSTKVLVFKLVCFAFILFCASCKAPTVESVGGINVVLECDQKDIESTQDLLKNRFMALTDNASYISSSIEGNRLTFELPMIVDSSAVRQLVEWDRAFRLCRSLDPSIQARVRVALADFITIPSKDKPYKSGSMIGLVDDHQRSAIINLIGSDSFKQSFPEVRDYYWGVKKMEGMSALFMEASSSAFISEDMFQKLEGFASKDRSEGVFSLQLKEEYTDRIGQLTGNDSTYLLHIFHREVYISKIIKPHITQPNFGMSGAFTISDAKVLGALWASKPLKNPVKIVGMDVIKAESE